MDDSLTRLGLIVAVALAAHVFVLAIRAFSKRVLLSRHASETKVHTLTSFGSSLLVFSIYFAAVGFVLTELGVPLTTYLASASVIGLAVSFGSQGVVQDLITGLTVVFSDLLDVGDLVEIGGQVGIVESIGMRFTVLINFSGARVFIPNRSLHSVVDYPSGYVRGYVDVQLPKDPSTHDAAEQRARELAESAYDQYPGILLRPPTIVGRTTTRAGVAYLRIKFRFWPGQGALLETAVKPAIASAMKQLATDYADWMITVHYRAESQGDDPRKILPRPSVLRRGRM